MVTTPVAPDEMTLRERFDTDEIVGYERSPSDVLRLLVYGTVAIVLLIVTRYAQDAVLGFEQDLVSALSFLEPPAERVLDGIAQLLWAIAFLGILVFPFVLRRYRLLGYLVVANIVASALVNAAIEFVDQDAPKRIANELAERVECTSAAPSLQPASPPCRRRSCCSVRSWAHDGVARASSSWSRSSPCGSCCRSSSRPRCSWRSPSAPQWVWRRSSPSDVPTSTPRPPRWPPASRPPA